MGNVSVKHKCGHWAKRPAREAERWVSQLCPECYRVELERRRRLESEAAAAWAREAGLPELVGTPKQVAWAEVIRREKLKAAEQYFGLVRPEFAEAVQAVRNRLRGQRTATWWIDRRHEDFSRPGHRGGVPEGTLALLLQKELEKRGQWPHKPGERQSPGARRRAGEAGPGPEPQEAIPHRKKD